MPLSIPPSVAAPPTLRLLRWGDKTKEGHSNVRKVKKDAASLQNKRKGSEGRGRAKGLGTGITSGKADFNTSDDAEGSPTPCL